VSEFTQIFPTLDIGFYNGIV